MIKQTFKRVTKIFKQPVEIKQSWTNEPSKYQSMVDFLDWFDNTKSIEDTLQKASQDWKDRIVNFKQYQDIEKNYSLEIGFGGGRLVSFCQLLAIFS